MSSRRSAEVNHGVRWVIGLGLMVNLLGYAVYKNAGRMDHWAPAFSRGISTADSSDVPPPPAVTAARQYRTAGLKALESGDYALAVQSFQKALQSSNALPDVPDLLRIAKSLNQKAPSIPLPLAEPSRRTP